jgi:hypothetical protein
VAYSRIVPVAGKDQLPESNRLEEVLGTRFFVRAGF